MNNATFEDDIHMLAGEYVLGLMDDAERAAFEARLATDAGARAAVAAARERFHEIDTSAAPVAPSAGLWNRIESAIGEAPSNVVDLAAHRRGDAPSAAARSGAPAPTRRSFWQGFAAASVLASIGSGYGLYTIARQKPRMIVVLLDSQAQPVSLVETYEGQRIRVVPLTNIAVPEGKALQVWTLPSRETGPVSMGLLPGPAATTLVGPDLPTPKLEQLYEITIEQAGGSPTGKPTGPIVGKGFAKLPQV